MDLDQTLIKNLSQKIGISEANIIHEYYELKFLYEISLNYLLSKNLIFKGGTALRLIYLSDRFSDDLDFDLIENKTDEKQIFKELDSIAKKINFKITDKYNKKNTILYEISYKKGSRKIKIEISKIKKKSEKETIIKNIINQIFPYSININTYSLETLMAGKINAVLTRKKKAPRDIYDLFYFLSQNTEFDFTYLKSLPPKKYSNRLQVYKNLLKEIKLYKDTQIKNELNILLPKSKRKFVVEILKKRLEEIIKIKINNLKSTKR